MTASNEQLRLAELLTLEDGDVIAAVDARELRGRVGKRLPELATVAYVTVGDLEKWLAERAANYGTESHTKGEV